jgi:hypothetical protein
VTIFPPQDIHGFLTCCAGEWLAVRSRFTLDAADGSLGGDRPREEEDGAEDWHDSERGQLLVTYLEPQLEGEPGGLAISAPSGGLENGVRRRLIFSASGRFHGSPGGAAGEGEEARQEEGTWELRQDGSLELTFEEGAVVVKERIWFPKPNLRLRSSVEHRVDGRPGRARFSSEIRRVRPPQETTPAAFP